MQYLNNLYEPGHKMKLTTPFRLELLRVIHASHNNFIGGIEYQAK